MNATTTTNVEVDVVSWVVSIGMGLAFAASGTTQLCVPKKRLAQRGASWVDDFSSGTVGANIFLLPTSSATAWLRCNSRTSLCKEHNDVQSCIG